MEENDVILPADPEMEDNDIILPADPEAKAREAAAKEYIEKQNEIDEANKRLYERAYNELLKAGYSESVAAAYHKDPSIINRVRDALDAEAYEEFLKEYPNVKPDEISLETWKAFNRNGNLVKSFEKHDPFLNGLEEEIPGEFAKGKPDPDPFIAGFDSE